MSAPAEASGVVPAPARSFALPLAIAVTVLAWASAFVVIRGVGVALSPGALALARLLVGAVALGLVQTRRTWVRPSTREWALLTGYGVLWFGGYNVGLNLAETALDAGTTAMIVGIGPILLALAAALVLHEGLPKPLLLGVLVSFAGVLIIGVQSGARGLADVGGVLAAVAAAVVYTLGVLCQKPVVGRLPAIQVTFLGAAIGAVACLPFLPQLVGELGEAPPAAIAGAVYLGLVPTALAFTTWSYALTRLPAARLGITNYLVPPLVIVFALLAFGEVPAPLAIVGGVLCLAGVAVARRRKK